MILDKFMLTLSNDNKELFILHTETPSLIIHIKKETPMRFILIGAFDEAEESEYLKIGALAKEWAKDYFSKNSISDFNMN